MNLCKGTFMTFVIGLILLPLQRRVKPVLSSFNTSALYIFYALTGC